jgi:hypothetical protein
VVISDAFRYEIGDELHSLIRQEDRFERGIGAGALHAAQLHPAGHGGTAAE